MLQRPFGTVASGAVYKGVKPPPGRLPHPSSHHQFPGETKGVRTASLTLHRSLERTSGRITISPFTISIPGRVSRTFLARTGDHERTKGEIDMHTFSSQQKQPEMSDVDVFSPGPPVKRPSHGSSSKSHSTCAHTAKEEAHPAHTFGVTDVLTDLRVSTGGASAVKRLKAAIRKSANGASALTLGHFT